MSQTQTLCHILLQSAYWCKDWDVSTSYLQSLSVEDAQAAARRRLASPWTWVVLLLLTAALLLRKHRTDSVGRGKKRDTAQYQQQQQQQQRNGNSSTSSSRAEYDVEGNRYIYRVRLLSFTLCTTVFSAAAAAVVYIALRGSSMPV